MINWLGYDWQMQSAKTRIENYKRFVSSSDQLLNKYLELSRQEKFKLYIVVHPLLDELQRNNLLLEFSLLEKVIQEKSIPVIDMLPVFNNYIQNKPGNYSDIFGLLTSTITLLVIHFCWCNFRSNEEG